MHTAYTVDMGRRVGSSLVPSCQVEQPGVRQLCSKHILQQGGQGMQLCLAAAEQPRAALYNPGLE